MTDIKSKPVTKDRVTQIKFNVATPLAQHIKLLGLELGWGLSHTDTAKFILLRAVAEYQEAETHKKRADHLPEISEEDKKAAAD